MTFHAIDSPRGLARDRWSRAKGARAAALQSEKQIRIGLAHPVGQERAVVAAVRPERRHSEARSDQGRSPRPPAP